MLIALMLAGFAMAQDAGPIGACNVTFKVTCMDCSDGDEFKAEIYQFTADGTRAQVAYLPHMKSGESISTGDMTPGRRTLVIKDEDFVTVGCVSGETVHFPFQVKLNSDTEPEEEDDFESETPPPAPVVTTVAPPAEPVRISPPEPSPQPPATPVVADPPLPAASEPPPAREEEEDETVIPYNVGWGAPGGPPIWVGNPGDYPGRGLGRNGTFLNSDTTHCEEGKLPLVVGTADHIVGGHVNQVALDDARASAVAPSNWDGEYVGYTGTTVVGDGAAAIYCVEPGTITRRESVAAVAAELPPPAPPGVSPEDLERMANELREELKPLPEVEPPPAPPGTSSTPFKLIERYGPFGALIRNESEEDLLYVHGVGGFFVTFNLWRDRIGLEPYIAFGSDGESTHPCSYNEQGELTRCSGWYPSIYWGARVPVRLVNFWKFQLHAFAGVGVVQDDINEGFHTWGQLTQYTGGLEVRFVGFKSFKPALSLEAGGSSVSYLNGSLTHTTGSAWVFAPNLKVGF